MTVSAKPPITKANFTGLTDYSFGFLAYADADISVYHLSTLGVSTVLTLTTDYTLARDEDQENGVLTMVSNANTIALGSTGTIVMYRSKSQTQGVVWPNYTSVNLARLEKSFDELTMMVQEIQSEVDLATLSSEWQGDWAADTDYELNDLVIGADDNLYICIEAHTSGSSFATDVSTSTWAVYVDVSVATDAQTAAETAQTNTEAYYLLTVSAYNLVVGLAGTAASSEAAAQGCLDAMNVDASITYDIGSGGDYATFTAAFTDLVPRYAGYTGSEIKVVLRAVTGYVMEEQLFFTNTDLSLFELTSVDAEVVVSRSALTVSFNSFYPVIGAENARMPKISILFNMNTSGTSTGRCGIVCFNSSGVISSGAGVKTAVQYGLYVSGASQVMAASTDFSASGSYGYAVNDGGQISASSATGTLSIVKNNIYAAGIIFQ